eukprot:15112593-Alexandrium_andersonii.AAC.1
MRNPSPSCDKRAQCACPATHATPMPRELGMLEMTMPRHGGTSTNDAKQLHTVKRILLLSCDTRAQCACPAPLASPPLPSERGMISPSGHSKDSESAHRHQAMPN